MWRVVLLSLCLASGPAAAELAVEVQRKLDAAAAVVPDSREAALRRFLLLREAETIVEKVLSAGPPTPGNAAVVTPEAMAERAGLRDAAAKDFAQFCEGREPRQCLLAEAEALLAEAPEVDTEAERAGAIGPSRAGRKIAVSLARAWRFDEGLSVAKGIADANRRNRAVRDIVIHLARDKQFGRATHALGELDQIWLVSEALTEIMNGMIAAGAGSDIESAMSNAVYFATQAGDESSRGQALAFVGMIYLDLGNIAGAEALFDRIEDDFWRDTLKNWVARRLAENGDFEFAELRAASVEDEWEAAEAFQAVAVELAKAGQLAEARRVAGRIEGLVSQTRAIGTVALALSEEERAGAAEMLAEAEALARGIGDANDRTDSLGEVAEALVRTGDSPAAVAIAAELEAMGTDPSEISWALQGIAEDLRYVGLRDASVVYALRAERLALKIEDVEGRSGRLLSLARLLLNAAAYVEAEEVAARIEDANDRVFALKDLGVALARSGKGKPDARAEVLRIAAVIGEIDGAKYWRGDGLKDVAQALAVAGDVAGAEAVAGGIAEPMRRNEALAGSAVALAEGGQFVEAERIARRIEDAAWRAVGLGAVGAEL